MPPRMPRRGLSVLGARSLPAGTDHHHPEAIPIQNAAPGLGQVLLYHAAGHRVYGRPADLKAQPGLRHHAHAFAPLYRYGAGLAAYGHLHHYVGAVRHVGVVTAVLGYRAYGPGGGGPARLDRHLQIVPLGSRTATRSGMLPAITSRAARAPAAAHVPVVYPVRSWACPWECIPGAVF